MRGLKWLSIGAFWAKQGLGKGAFLLLAYEYVCYYCFDNLFNI